MSDWKDALTKRLQVGNTVLGSQCSRQVLEVRSRKPYADTKLSHCCGVFSHFGSQSQSAFEALFQTHGILTTLEFIEHGHTWGFHCTREPNFETSRVRYLFWLANNVSWEISENLQLWLAWKFLHKWVNHFSCSEVLQDLAEGSFLPGCDSFSNSCG